MIRATADGIECSEHDKFDALCQDCARVWLFDQRGEILQEIHEATEERDPPRLAKAIDIPEELR